MKKLKRYKPWITLFLILLILFCAGIILKNILLFQLKKRIEADFDYNKLHFSLFPPLLVIEEMRTLSLSPFFSAKKVALSISYKSLLSKEKPLVIFIEQPVLRVYGSSSPKKGVGKVISFPFEIEKGVIRGAEVFFFGRDNRLQGRKINASFTQKRGSFSCKLEADDVVCSLKRIKKEIEGKAEIYIEGEGRKIFIKKATIQSPEGILKADGLVSDLFNPFLQVRSSFKIDFPLIADYFNLPFEWKGRAEGKAELIRREGKINIKADFLSGRLFLNEILAGNVRGNLDFDQEKGGVIELNIQKKNMAREYLRIMFSEKGLSGEARGFFLDPLINDFKLPWPVGSPFWGKFTLVNKKLSAEGEFRDEYLNQGSDKFPFRGMVKFEWNGVDKISLHSQELGTGFGLFSLQGEINLKQDVEFFIEGEIKDLSEARRFTSISLNKDFSFPEIRGKGKIKLRIFGSYFNPKVQTEFSFSPGGFMNFDSASVQGEAKIEDDVFKGEFMIEDPSMRGRVFLSSIGDRVRVMIQAESASLERVFSELGLRFPLKGEASGNVEYLQEGKEGSLKGEFFSNRVILEGQQFDGLRGKLSWNEDEIYLQDLSFSFYKGLARGHFYLNNSSREFDIAFSGEGLDISCFLPRVKGELKLGLKGKGRLDQDFAQGEFEVRGLQYGQFERIESKGVFKLGYSEDKFLGSVEGLIFPGENEARVRFEFNPKSQYLSGELRGFFNNLDLLLPLRGTKGRLNYLLELKQNRSLPEVKGVIDFQGTLFVIPGFAHALRDYSALVFIENHELSLRSFHAKLGGGDVQGAGWARIGRGSLEKLEIRMEGKNLLISPLERARALADGSLKLVKDGEQLKAEGEITFKSVSWRREIFEKFTFSTLSLLQPQRKPGIFDNLILDIRLRADDNAWIENSLGKARGRFDLKVTGSVLAPILLGEIELLEGKAFFQDREFEILKGKLSFFNPSTIEPYLSFKGETYVKDYRVSFSLEGFIDRLRPEFSSSPPLPPEDVLALLAMGEAFKRTYSYDRSTQLSTASLISFQLSEEAKKRAEKLFSLDRFRIDPFVLGSSAEMTARLTVGKKLSRNFSLLYSTNLASLREEITRLEWELGRDISIVGTRNEEGRISIDVKVHKRF